MIEIDPARPKGIVWLASYPRSGNTWTRIFLAALANIMEGRREAAVDLNRVDRFSIEDSVATLYADYLGRPPHEATPQEVAEARPHVLHRLVEETDGIVAVKTHNANVAAFGVRLIPPEVSAGAIYLVRNPLDVAVSFARFRDVSIDQTIADLGTSGLARPNTEERVFILAGSWSEHVETWSAAPNPALLVVRYEDMVDKPLEAFAAIAAHVRMEASAEQLAEAVEQTTFKRLRALEKATGFRERPSTTDRFFRSGTAGQWRTLLSPAQIDRVINDHLGQMARFGYLPQ